MIRRSWRVPAVAAIVATAGLSTTSCASEPLDFESAQAFLDVKTQTIVTPLDAFSPSPEEAVAIEHANVLVLARCMNDQGLEYPRAATKWETRPPIQDRTFGIWSPELAQLYGYELPPDPDSARISKIEESLPDSWWETWHTCLARNEQLPLAVPFSSQNETPVDQGTRESLEGARNDDAWKAAVDDWTDCVEEAGLQVSDVGGLFPDLTTDLESNMHIAVADVKCKEDNRIAQRLGNILAAYEDQFIQAHESELIEYRNWVEKTVSMARERIADGS